MRLIVTIDDDIATLRRKMQEEQRVNNEKYEMNAL